MKKVGIVDQMRMMTDGGFIHAMPYMEKAVYTQSPAPYNRRGGFVSEISTCKGKT